MVTGETGEAGSSRRAGRRSSRPVRRGRWAPAPERQTGHPGVAPVEAAVGRTRPLGVDAEDAAPVEHVAGRRQGPLRGAAALAAHGDLAGGPEEPAVFHESKYSALATKVTRRRSTRGTNMESTNDTWLGARITGPCLGMFSRPSTFTRHKR